MIKDTESSKAIRVFLDVEIVFISVLVEETIHTVVDNVYELTPPKIPPNLLEEMLLTCTNEPLFVTSTGLMYVQRNGCYMGSCPAPTLVNFCIGYLNKILKSQSNMKP